MNGWVADICGQEMADKVGKVWGLGSNTKKDPGPWEGELRNMWKPTQQEALWFHGGNLHQSRHYSQFLALQLKARLEGLPPRSMGCRRSITRREVVRGAQSELFGMEATRRERPWAAISCRKSEIELSLHYEHSVPSACQIGGCGPDLFRDDKSGKKNSSCFHPRNPLKSLEFGQIPRKSKEIQPPRSGVFGANGDKPRKPKSGRPD